MDDESQWPTIDELVAKSLSRFREELSWDFGRAEDVASLMRKRGVPWTRNTVTAIERGKRKVPMGEVIALVSALPISATDFFWDEQVSMVRLAGDTHMSLANFLAILEPLGRPDFRQDIDFMSANALPADRRIDGHELIESIVESGERFEFAVNQLRDEQKFVLVLRVTEAERRAALRFGVTPEVVLLASHALWGAGLEEVRDRAGSGGNAQKGHRTRDLYDELRETIERRS